MKQVRIKEYMSCYHWEWGTVNGKRLVGCWYFLFLIWMEIKQVCTCGEIHQDVYLQSVHYPACILYFKKYT